jgi:hypothetical protein
MLTEVGSPGTQVDLIIDSYIFQNRFLYVKLQTCSKGSMMSVVAKATEVFISDPKWKGIRCRLKVFVPETPSRYGI